MTKYTDNYAADYSDAIEQLHNLIDKIEETDITLEELDALIMDIMELVTD